MTRLTPFFLLVLAAGFLAALGRAETPSGTAPNTPRPGEAANFRPRFNPPVGTELEVRESESVDITIWRPSGERRSRLTTNVVTGRLSFEQTDTGWRQTEVVDSVQRSIDGLLFKEPMTAALTGLKLVSLLDPAGRFVDLANGADYRTDLLARLQAAPVRDRAAASITPESLTTQCRQGWQKKVGRFLSIPFQIGVPVFEAVSLLIPDVGTVSYFLCHLPTEVKIVDGQAELALEVRAFSVSLKDGFLEGVPDELATDFARWAEGRELTYSAENLQMSGEGDIVLTLSGVGTKNYWLAEAFTLAPARVTTPLEGPVEATQVRFKRVSTFTLGSPSHR